MNFAEKPFPEIVTSLSEHVDDALLAMKMLETRYDGERRLMQAVSQGVAHKADQIISSSSELVLEMRVPDPVRNMKNYVIITNVLLRKAAEQGGVHPFYIDGVSSSFAKRLEQIKTVEEGIAMQHEMVYTYSTLVKNHSMKKFSLLVQKVITLIDFDLTADLSLSKQAELLNVNASYLSALFKKETGMTLTEFVNKKRIDHAAFLLSSTNLQIQTIAQNCGIYDVNYFTKMFKTSIGKTPIEYINGLRVNKAMELLYSTKKSMAEIADEIGFCNPNYFHKIFKQYMELSPLAYRKKVKG
jgi:YesN/AraC family two-component response regulator